MTPALREWKFASNHVQLKMPDVLWHKVQGVTTLEDAVQLMEIYREVATQQPFFLVTDLSEATTLTDKARRYASEHLRPEWFVGSIYIGARLLHRAVAKGLALIHHLTGRTDATVTSVVHFVNTEAEAWALIDQLRTKRQEGQS